MADTIVSDVEEAARSLGIEGLDEVGEMSDGEIDSEVDGLDEVGAKRRLKKAHKAIRKMAKKIRVTPSYGGFGDERILPMACVAPLPLAAAGVGNLIFTPNRNVRIVDVMLEAYALAAVWPVLQQQSIHMTNITVQGRTLWPAAGVLPISSFSRDAVNRRIANMQYLDLGECASTQNVVFALINNDAATACTVVGTVWVICTP